MALGATTLAIGNKHEIWTTFGFGRKFEFSLTFRMLQHTSLEVMVIKIERITFIN